MSLKATLTSFALAMGVVIATPGPAGADVPTYRHKSEVPASQSERLKLAARYVETPGRALSAPSGPIMARQVVIGRSKFIVVSNAGRNSVNDITTVVRRQTDCMVARNANFRTIRTGGIVPTGYAMPCSG